MNAAQATSRWLAHSIRQPEYPSHAALRSKMAGDQLGALSSAKAGITCLAKNRQQKETDVRDRHRFFLAWVQSAATDNSLTEHHVAKPDPSRTIDQCDQPGQTEAAICWKTPQSSCQSGSQFDHASSHPGFGSEPDRTVVCIGDEPRLNHF